MSTRTCLASWEDDETPLRERISAVVCEVFHTAPSPLRDRECCGDGLRAADAVLAVFAAELERLAVFFDDLLTVADGHAAGASDRMRDVWAGKASGYERVAQALRENAVMIQRSSDDQEEVS